MAFRTTNPTIPELMSDSPNVLFLGPDIENLACSFLPSCAPFCANKYPNTSSHKRFQFFFTFFFCNRSPPENGTTLAQNQQKTPIRDNMLMGDGRPFARRSGINFSSPWAHWFLRPDADASEPMQSNVQPGRVRLYTLLIGIFAHYWQLCAVCYVSGKERWNSYSVRDKLDAKRNWHCCPRGWACSVLWQGNEELHSMRRNWELDSLIEVGWDDQTLLGDWKALWVITAGSKIYWKDISHVFICKCGTRELYWLKSEFARIT